MIGAAPPYGKEWLVRHDGPTIPNLSRQEPGAPADARQTPRRATRSSSGQEGMGVASVQSRSERLQAGTSAPWRLVSVWAPTSCCLLRSSVCFCSPRLAPSRRGAPSGRPHLVRRSAARRRHPTPHPAPAQPQRRCRSAEQCAIGLRQRSTHPIRDTPEHWFGEGQLAGDVLCARAAGGCHRISAAWSARRRRQRTNPTTKHDALQRVAGRLAGKASSRSRRRLQRTIRTPVRAGSSARLSYTTVGCH